MLSFNDTAHSWRTTCKTSFPSPSSPSFSGWPNWILGPERCAMFWKIYKTIFPFFYIFAINKISILCFSVIFSPKNVVLFRFRFKRGSAYVSENSKQKNKKNRKKKHIRQNNFLEPSETHFDLVASEIKSEQKLCSKIKKKIVLGWNNTNFLLASPFTRDSAPRRRMLLDWIHEIYRYGVHDSWGNNHSSIHE